VTDVDFDRVVALVVTTRTEHAETIIAEGRYVTETRRVRAALPKWPSRRRRITNDAAAHAYSCGTSFE
jgi:hypothetical protein